ncbi:MAG: DUF2147 domain-containing protein [Marinifilaceae bacterium]
MKHILILVLTLCSYVANAQIVTGKWVTFDDETKKEKSEVEIYEKDGKFYGKVVKLYNLPTGVKENDVKCTKCKDAKKNAPVIGMNIIENMEYKDGEYKGGTITDPKNGKSYTCTFMLDPKDHKILIVKGHLGPFSRAQYWKRP